MNFKSILIANKTKEDEIKHNKVYFGFYRCFPLIITIVLFSIFILAGLILMIIGSGYSYYGETYMLIGFLGCWVGGSIISVLTFLISKVAFSYKILHIKYLETIIEGKDFVAETSEPIVENVSEEKVSAVETPKAAFCKNCGKKLDEEMMFCENCGTHR